MFDFVNLIDYAAVMKIVMIDIMLGVDNAILIALACAALPLGVRNKAIFWGTAGAIILRAVLLVFASLILTLPYLKLLAGSYLLYIGYSLLMNHGEEHSVDSPDSMMSAIKTIIIADFMMSLDNVMAVAGAATSAGEHSTIYAIAGIVLSIPIIVLGSKVLIGLMEKYPAIIWFGAGMLGWVGAEMVISEPIIDSFIGGHESIYAIGSKITGFVSVLFAVFAMKHFKKVEE